MASVVNAPRYTSSIAVRASISSVWFSIASPAPNADTGVRRNSSCRQANTPSTVAVPASVPKIRHPHGVSPNSAMPAAMNAFATSGCSVFAG